ncbi:unnamed protein product, partial [marine sediment metagenome]
MNKIQKIILAIFIPIIIFFITFTIAYYVSVEAVITPSRTTSVPTSLSMKPEVAKATKLFEDAAGNPNWQP